MELVLAVLMGLGIFLVIPVIIGLSIIGIYFVNRRRVLKAERTKLLKGAVADMERVIEEADFDQVPGTPVEADYQEYVKSK
jgi:hypothetical protein